MGVVVVSEWELADFFIYISRIFRNFFHLYLPRSGQIVGGQIVGGQICRWSNLSVVKFVGGQIVGGQIVTFSGGQNVGYQNVGDQNVGYQNVGYQKSARHQDSHFLADISSWTAKTSDFHGSAVLKGQ